MEIEDEEEDKFIKENPIIFKKYKVKKKFGEGAFGDVYLGQEISNKAYVAIKIEPRKIIKPILESEAFLLYSIAGPGIPGVKSFGKTKEYNILVEPLLGKSLFDIFTENHKNMHLADACLIAKQVIDRIQWVHSKYIVHRDIKPDNFLIGRNDPNVIYLIDFGLSKKYRSSTTGKHIRFGFTGKLTGTVRFASANALRGGEQSRRDDIESIGYMLVYFLKRKLPWQGVTANKKMERYLKIYKMKKNITPEKLCEGLFPEMVEYISYAKNLEFEQEPNYNYLKNLFNKMLKRIHNSNDQLVFSWIKMTDFKAFKNPINPASRKDSPQNRIYKKIKSKLEQGRSASSDSDSKAGSYRQIAMTSTKDINYVENQMVNSSLDQFEIKEKKVLNKSLKSKEEGLNTTIANLEVSFDENVDFENEKIKGSKDKLSEINKNLIEINRNLNTEFIKDENREQNKDDNDTKGENINNNNNKSLANNISDNSNKKKSDDIDIKEQKDLIINSDLKQNSTQKDKEAVKESKKDTINIKKEIKKILLEGADFTFNETLNSNQNDSNVNNELKAILTEKKEQKIIQTNSKEIINNNKKNENKSLRGSKLKANEERLKKDNLKNLEQEKNDKINKNLNINNNKPKSIKIKTLKKGVKKPLQNITITNIKKVNIKTNKTFNKIKEGKHELEIKTSIYKVPEDDIIKEITNETNNNLYNIFNKNTDFNIDIDNLKKRPSVGPSFNPLSLNKKQGNKKVNKIK